MGYKNFDDYLENHPINRAQTQKSLILAFREVAEAAWNAAIESSTPSTDEEGWIEWDWGEPNVGMHVVDIKLLDDSVYKYQNTADWDWSDYSDIIAYRLSK